MTYEPGDIIFYLDDGTWKHHFFAVMQNWFKERGLINGTDFTHVAMIANDPDLIVEMVWPRPRFRFLADDTRPKVIKRPNVDAISKTRAIYWCYFNIGAHYSFWDMFLGLIGVRKAYKLCSGWIDQAYKEAGAPLTPISDKLVSPDELASSSFLDTIQ